MATSTQTSKPKSRRKPKEPQKPGAKRSKNKSSLLSPDQLNKVKKIDRVKLLAAVFSRVEGELFGELFPERIELWEHLKSGDRLLNLVTFSAEKYLKLYDECSTICEKDAELFLRWLDVVRSLTCKERHTDETQTLLIRILDGCSVSNVTQQTLLAIILNAIHLGLCKQMAETVEEISLAIHESANLDPASNKPSDDVALHRICGWALKSAADYLRTQMSACASQEHGKVANQLELTKSLKLPDSDKCLLPKLVQYLDRGGLTFLRPPFWPWMIAIEDKIADLLSQKHYRIHGDKIFRTTHTTITADQDLLDKFQHGIVEAGIQSTTDTVKCVHKMLVDKICNARCNEFLRSIGKLACIDKNKAVDGSVSLRDELKVYALKTSSE